MLCVTVYSLCGITKFYKPINKSINQFIDRSMDNEDHPVGSHIYNRYSGLDTVPSRGTGSGVPPRNSAASVLTVCRHQSWVDCEEQRLDELEEVRRPVLIRTIV